MAYAFALVLSVTMGVCLLGIPVQLTDSLANLTEVQRMTLGQIVDPRALQGAAYIRPFLSGLLKIVFDLADGREYVLFRGLQVLQVAALLLLVVRLLRVRSMTEAASVPLCLAVLVCVPTFAGTVREAFPINTFLTILLCSAAAASLSESRGGLWADALACLLLIFSMLTVETGLLVWVIFVTLYIVGARGVSRGGVVAATVCVAGYAALRLAMGGASPGLNERDSGFGFASHTASELSRMFEGNPLPFYLYNVASAIGAVLFSEPRGGVWRFAAGLAGRAELWPWQTVSVVTSVVTSLVMGRYVASRLPRWRQREFDAPDRLVVLFLALVPANAVFAYAKDVIMSPVGVFYGLAAATAVRGLLFDPAPRRPRWARTALHLALVVVVCGWSFRLLGIHYSLRQAAPVVRNEWAYIDDWQAHQRVAFTTPEQIRLRERLYQGAIVGGLRLPVLSGEWADRWFDITQ